MINIPKGTKDMLPEEAYKWHYVENTAREVASLYGFKEIRTPIFEHTELFLRGVGETTDIVTKEMYTFEDKGNRSITLKPEGTAGVVRSYIENALDQVVLPMKAYYISPIFRYERPQNGRLREHHQFGVEMFGAEGPEADGEIISLANTLLKKVGLTAIRLYINSIGCPECRKNYNKALMEYIGSNLDKMCNQCKERFNKNPLRILDCKEEGCKAITANAPKVTDYLCEDCKAHFEGVKANLDARGIEYEVNPQIVRGLDYYTRTVFEFVSTDIGAQGTVCGGGRYNGLVSELGGKDTPAVGFGCGLERLILVLENTNSLKAEKEISKIYIAPMGENAKAKATQIVDRLRSCGIKAETDLMNRSVKAQMKYANKIGVEYVVVIGDSELESGVVEIKDMANSTSEQIKLDDICAYLSK
ncbi:MAG: histidine--tRNA ligase [Clostridia bacterium]|nr:histidine--tRNA ligase [Clostridia bacterium]